MKTRIAGRALAGTMMGMLAMGPAWGQDQEDDTKEFYFGNLLRRCTGLAAAPDGNWDIMMNTFDIIAISKKIEADRSGLRACMEKTLGDDAQYVADNPSEAIELFVKSHESMMEDLCSMYVRDEEKRKTIPQEELPPLLEICK